MMMMTMMMMMKHTAYLSFSAADGIYMRMLGINSISLFATLEIASTKSIHPSIHLSIYPSIYLSIQKEEVADLQCDL